MICFSRALLFQHDIGMQVLGKDQLLLLSQVKRNKECIEAHLRDTDSRTHHRVLHSHLLPYKIPKPCLKRLL